MKTLRLIHHNQSGFIIADFLFAMVLVISTFGILFVLCFSLATVEISQYIIWSSARSYSAANVDANGSVLAGKSKFNYLAKQFPLLTGVGADVSWFELTLKDIGNNPAVIADLQQINIRNELATGESRHPWTGAAGQLDVSLFRRLNLPFIGKLSEDDDVFKYNLRAFILRNPSQSECLDFFSKKYEEGISQLEGSWGNRTFLNSNSVDFVPQEDNGC